MSRVSIASVVSTIPFASFWSSPWAAPLRESCVWLQRQAAPVVPPTPDRLVPDWLRPLCFQREIGRTIRARLANARRDARYAATLYAYASQPTWGAEDWRPYGRGVLRSWSKERLLEHFQMELERLLRIMQTPPALLGEAVWTHSALGTCEHLAQLYQEFRRRYGARRTRRFMCKVLTGYAWWFPAEEA
jgi:hypothetical protein